MAAEATTTLPHARSDLALSWRRLGRFATIVCLLAAPSIFLLLHVDKHYSIPKSVLWTVLAFAAFRGLVDITLRRFLPSPSLFGTESPELIREDIVARRRVWFWQHKLRLAIWVGVIAVILWAFSLLTLAPGESGDLVGKLRWPLTAVSYVKDNFTVGTLLQVFFLFIANFLIFMGPLMMAGIMQVKGYEPGDANWGVKLDHVRGQKEAKEEVRRIVNLWQSGEYFEQAGGKRERGVLFLGPPGTGKTMLAKGIATGFNCPFVAIPGSGFAGTFIGIDALIVRFLAWKAKKLARKWGGQCIVFIDEIDAVGLRRQSLGTSMTAGDDLVGWDLASRPLYGPMGAINQSGDLILQNRAWRDRQFGEREDTAPVSAYRRIGAIVHAAFPGGMFGGGGGQLALNQLLVVMDGLGEPPLLKKTLTNRVNTLLDALYLIPHRIGSHSLRLRPPKPRSEQIYFIGACNVPIEALDPALTRPGRLGRHVWFRRPTKTDRKDIFDLYLGKVAHEPDLDSPRRRDELSRITDGYSPAMIEQVCSMALTKAHHEGRLRFGWTDIVESLTTVESGTAVGVEYVERESRAVAVHEAGHAVCSHVFMKGRESTRLSIRMRGGSLGHHAAREKEERFSSFRSEMIGDLIWCLGAMAAERVFYGENSNGVGGDVNSATWTAAAMVGLAGMPPERVDLTGKYVTLAEEDAAREKIEKRFERIGSQIMNRSGSADSSTVARVLMDRNKSRDAAILLGQAYMAAHHLILANREGVAHVADVLTERKELYGDEIVELLDSLDLQVPTVDLTEERAWPRL